MLAILRNRIAEIFSSGWSFLRPRKKLGLVSFVLISTVILVVWFAWTNQTFAGWGDDITSWISSILLWLASLAMSATIFVLRYIIELGGYNGFIDSTAVLVGWTMVRDIANMFFVVALLLIAFGTILGIDAYEWKKLLGKLIFAAVIVNFSRIICGVIIDAAQVVMVTFINGVQATAGGNLLQMFNLNDLMKFSSGTSPDQVTAQLTFTASVGALTFSVMALMTMLIFLVMLLARMVMLWIAIVLSPLAFVLGVLPQTQKFASQWWSEFGGNVVSGPIIAFFLWLAFVTVGAGNVHNQIQDGSSTRKLSDESGGDFQNAKQMGITDAMGWDKMANFAVAIGMLLAGAKMAQQLGAAGGSMMSKVGEIGKKVAMTASGIRAGRWAAAGIGTGIKKGAKWGAMNVPLVGGRSWQARGLRMKSAASHWWTKNWVEPGNIAAGKRVARMYDKNPDGTPKHGWLNRQTARVGTWFAPQRYKDELAKDAETAAKLAAEQQEHVISTSKTPIGQKKLEAESRLNELKETGQDIKKRKLADKYIAKEGMRGEIDSAIEAEIDSKMNPQTLAEINAITDEAEKTRRMEGARNDLRETATDKVLGQIEKEGKLGTRKLDSSEMFDYTRWQNAKESAVKTQNIDETLKAAKDLERAQYKEIFSATGTPGAAREARTAVMKAQTKQIEDKLSADRELKELQEIRKLLMSTKGAAKQQDINLTRAAFENLKEDADTRKDESMAYARAKKFRDDHDFIRANQVVSEFQAKIAKRESERVSAMSWEDKKYALQIMPDKIAEIRGSVDRTRAAGNEDGARELEEIQKNLIRRSIALQSALKSEGKESSDLADQESAKKLQWTDPIDDTNRIRFEVSKILGKKIEQAGLNQAIEEIYKAFGGLEKAQGALTLFSNANKAAGMKGAGALFGMMKADRVGDKQVLSFADQINVEDGDYPTKIAEVDHRKWATASGYAKVSMHPDAMGKIVGFDENRAKQLAAIFEGKNELFIAQMQNGFFASLNSADTANRAEFERLLQEISNVLHNDQARIKFEERAAELLRKVGVDHLPPSAAPAPPAP